MCANSCRVTDGAELGASSARKTTGASTWVYTCPGLGAACGGTSTFAGGNPAATASSALRDCCSGNPNGLSLLAPGGGQPQPLASGEEPSTFPFRKVTC